MSDIEARLAKIGASDRGKPRKLITILGAGMAGLVAGYELKRLGHKVRILEGSQRVGGRVLTHRFADGLHGELGAMRIPLHHHYTRYYVGKMGLHLRRFLSAYDNPLCFLDIKNTITRVKDARTKLYGKFDLSQHQLALAIPPAIFSDAKDQLIGTLTDDERSELLSTETTSERVRKLDRICLGDFLLDRIGHGASEFVGLALGLEAFLDRSLTMFLRDAVASEGPELHEIAEGMDALPAALSKAVEAEIEFGTEIIGLAKRAGLTLILRRNNEIFERTFRGPVICTLPFTVLRSLPHGLRLSARKDKVVRRLGYTSSTKVLLHSTDRFWEKNYGIYGGASLTDTLVRAVYYPSDFARIIKEGKPTGLTGLYSGSVGGRFASSARGRRLRSRTDGRLPGVLLGSYTWSTDAKRMGALTPQDRRKATIAAIARLHPEISKPGMIDDDASIFWDETPWMRGGAFSYLEPRQQFEMVSESSRNEGNLYFAGEHCSLYNAWMQGAIVSAINAVESIVSA